MEKTSFHVNLSSGLDPRSIAEIVQVASRYDSTLHIQAKETRVNAKSIMGMMTLQLNPGEEITLVAEGGDEQDALNGLQTFMMGLN